MKMKLLLFSFAFAIFLALFPTQSIFAETYTATQCTNAGGSRYIGTVSECEAGGGVNLGDYLDAACVVGGFCCGPASSVGAPKVGPDCSAPVSCTSPAINGVCKNSCGGGESPSPGACGSGKQCCIAGAGGECSIKGGICQSGTCASKRRNTFTGSCTGDFAGQSCCTLTQLPGCAGVCRSGACGSGERIDTASICTDSYKVCCTVAISSSVSGPILSDYQLLEKIPGSTASSSTSGKLNVWLEDIYRFAFWAVGIAVVFMLTIGGFYYLTSAGNTSQLQTAKTIIFDAFLGLILALVAWLFLNLINPNLVKLTLPVSVTVNPSIPPTAPSTGSSVQGLAQRILAGGTGITLRGTGDCSDTSGTQISPLHTVTQVASGTTATHCQANCPSSGACTGKTNLSEALLNGLLYVAGGYPLEVVSLTGGPHTQASAHYAGRGADITTSNKGDWAKMVAEFKQNGANSSLTGCDLGGKKNAAGKPEYIVSSSRCLEATHIHVQY